MVNCMADYNWSATPWDWVLNEMKYVSTDMINGKKWKKAAAYKLSKEVQLEVPKIIEEWKYRETATKLVALKNSVLIKQAFYEQYIYLKNAKEEHELLIDFDSKKSKIGKSLQNLMRWVILNQEFQYEVPKTAYERLCVRLNPEEKLRGKDNIMPINSLQELSSLNEMKPSANDLLLMGMHDIGPSLMSMYESFEYRDGAPPIMILHDPNPGSFIESVPMPLNNTLLDMNLANLIEIPECNYNDIVDAPLNITGIPKSKKINPDIINGPEGEELKTLESLGEIFYIAPKSDEKASKMIDKNEEFIVFDINKNLMHNISRLEDKEFMEYIGYLPECTDDSYQMINRK